MYAEKYLKKKKIRAYSKLKFTSFQMVVNIVGFEQQGKTPGISWFLFESNALDVGSDDNAQRSRASYSTAKAEVLKIS